MCGREKKERLPMAALGADRCVLANRAEGKVSSEVVSGSKCTV